MSVTDPHSDCLWCLSSDHDVEKCDSCQRMNPKALKEREAKLFWAKSKKKEKRHHRKSSSPKSHQRHRDSRRRRESRCWSSRERSRSRSPSTRRRKTWEVSPTVSPQPPTLLASPTSPTSLMSPVNPPSVFEVPRPQVFSPTMQTSGPASMSPSTQAPQYLAFPAPGTNSSAFLNAMFSIFQQMAPGGGPAPLRPAPFMPFLPLGNVGSAPVASAPVASVSQPATPSRPPLAPEQSSDHPTPRSAPKKSMVPLDPASDGSEEWRQASTSADAMSTPRIEERLHSRRLALRLLEEQEYQRQTLEEGEIEDSREDLHGLDTASGLDTSPEWDLSSPGEYTEEVATFHSVIRKAADFLDLPLPVSEPKPNILTEVLHPASTTAEPLLPFNEALLDPIMEIWKKPVSSSAVNRSVAQRYRVASADPGFLSRHPTPESLVVQTSCSARSAPGSFPAVPSDRDSKKMDILSKKAFSSCSMALKSTNATCILGRYIYALMDEIKSTHTEVPQELLSLVSDAQAAATQVIQSGLDTTDSVARAMGPAVATRRQAWLRRSGFSSDVQSTLLDLPFDGDKLFGAKADSALERFKESRATAKSLGLQASSSASSRFFRRFRGFGRGSSSSFRGKFQHQPTSALSYRSYRGRGGSAAGEPLSSTLPLPLPLEGCSMGSSLRLPANSFSLHSCRREVIELSPQVGSHNIRLLGYQHCEERLCPTLSGVSAPHPARPSYCSEEHLLLLEQEVQVLLSKGAVELVPEQERGQGCYSRYFLIPKKDGRLRPILDLRILNWFLKQEKFKMLTLAQVLLALNDGDWMVSVDLQDAYFHIPILKSHRKYLRFVVGSQHYQFAVLPFGLTSAPQVFTKVMSVVAAELRRKGIAVFPYLDDWFIKAKSPELVLHHLQSTTQLLFDLGFSVNVPKSHLEPSQRLLFIGAVLDTTLSRAFPPPQRIQDIQALVPMFQSGTVILVLKVLRLLGLFASCILLVTHARWHMRALQWCLRKQWSQHKGDLEGSVRISGDAAADLKWWIADGNLSQGRPFSQPPPVTTVITDASTLGWGARLGDLEIKGLWSPVEQMFHINLLELRAVRLALKAFLPSLLGQLVQVLTDNTTAMWYINK
ncbi:hypothetical protein NDU88_007110 [Pleurodeles waltl]|uniref:ribonuclease H n=1 Tax=Pleurodeles waltl TaxID=8319 RepID=A0AAV7N2I6_PLEWA|nr:hypothetical protein NDU88_007110 [Pleurodeles waltl]